MIEFAGHQAGTWMIHFSKHTGLQREYTKRKRAPIQCPRCGTVNGATGKFCCKWRCCSGYGYSNVDKERGSLTMESWI